MEDYNGIAISKNDKEFVVAFDNFVNGKMQSATNTGKALATIHRYLQSQAFKVCVAYFRQLAVNYRTGYYDERNETAARIAAMMYDTLMNGDEIYDPIVGTNRGYAGILPNLFTTKEFHSIPNKERFIAKVVRVLQKDQYLIVSQKDVRKEDVQRFTLTTKGELVEVRFRRSGATFVPNILGHGPVRATVVFPKRFDYKQKYQAQVTRVIDICNCEIRLLHPIVTSKQKGQ